MNTEQKIKEILIKVLNLLEPSLTSDCVYRTPQQQLQIRINELNDRDKLIVDIKNIIK